MELIQLTSDYEMKPFDCGDAALNGFLCNDAKPFLEARLARTYLLCDDNRIVGYYCLLNDKVARRDVTNSDWRKIKKLFPHSKHFGSYPAVKIGRFAISVYYRGKGWGTELIKAIKLQLSEDPGYSQFRFLTVDAYQNAVPFYERNGFKKLTPTQEQERNGFKKLTPTQEQGDTQAMYFDIKSILES